VRGKLRPRGRRVKHVTRVLIVTGSELGTRMAGPAIRALAMARVLTADGHQVVLATTSRLDADAVAAGSDTPVQFEMTHVRPGDRAGFARLERAAEIIVFQGHAMEQFPALARTDRVVVADAYDPMHLEMLEQGKEKPRGEWDYLVSSRVRLLNQQLTRADLVLCASQRQRTLYLGQLASLGRISPATYENDPHAQRLLAVAPFGLDPVPPRHDRPALRGVVDGIGDNSRIALWGGGLYQWFDPLTLIRAVHALAQRDPRVVLVFLGTAHPGVDAMGIVRESYDLAQQLGALGTSVIFNGDWVPFAQRGAFYAEATAGVSTHHAHLETEFSFRTRILDYLWAGLPMVVTEGDSFADLVAQQELGVVVPANDQAALEAALERVLCDDAFAEACRARVAQVRDEFAWEVTLAPLRELARNPRRAADVERAGGRARLARSLRAVHRAPLPPGVRRDALMAAHYLRHGGLTELKARLATRRAKG